MKVLSNNEKVVFMLSALVTAAGMAGAVAKVQVVVYSALFLLIFLLVVLIALTLLRLERAATQQKRTREEIYQVLYTLHGNDQLTEHQARKTRDHVLRQYEALRDELSRMTKVDSKKNPKDDRDSVHRLETEAIKELAEEQRLRFNNLISILDTHWEVLEEKYNDTNGS